MFSYFKLQDSQKTKNNSFKVSKERRPPMKRTLPESGSIDSNALGDSPLDIKDGVSVSPPTKRPKLHLFHDHIYQITESPRSLKKKLDRSLNDLKLAKKKLKCSQQRSRRLKNKVMSLKSVVKDLKKKGMISEACLNQLQHSLAGIPLEMMKRLTSQKKTGKGVKYSPEIKSFALTLQFYSAKAYEFVRRTFNYALPHQAQIRRWYSKIPAEAGFTEPSFLAIKRKVESSNEKVVLSLMLDEMSIRKHIAWDGTKFRGYVDLGCGNESDDSSSVAKEVLVFMAVSVNGAWKIPLAYFFIDGLSGAERANLINVCLQRIWDTGAKVVSVTCDGPSCHFSMMSELGAKLDPNDLKVSFPHPCDNTQSIFVLLDICHMLKLVRNTLGEYGLLVDNEGQKIRWQYINELHKLQEKEGLRLGNKLKAAHIEWRQQKMKVNIAAQTFSSSVADAIEYCATHLKLKQFQGAEATIKFIRIFDRLFDMLNSRNPLAKGFKSPLRIGNQATWDSFFNVAFSYILGLKDSTGNQMHKSRRKTGFIGFLVGIKSTQGLFESLVAHRQAPLKYLLMYKFSQDHLELFFGAVRSAGGFNNNPTTGQFTAAYKRLLLRSTLKGGNGNCVKLDPLDSLLTIDNVPRTDVDTSLSSVLMARKYDLFVRKEPTTNEHDYADAPNLSSLTEYKQASISYIAGYVVKMVMKHILCFHCSQALGSKNQAYTSSFLKLKDRGGLIKPSRSVVIVCEETEKSFQRMLLATGGELPRSSGIPDAIAMSVLQNVDTCKVFQKLESHMFDSEIEDNHIFSLIKVIAKSYCKIKLHHLGKEYTQKLTGTRIRKKLSKIVLFSHQ